MRCIETTEAVHTDRLPKKINYNMRCIETDRYENGLDDPYEINYNMRCIETDRVKNIRNEFGKDKLQHEMY